MTLKLLAETSNDLQDFLLMVDAMKGERVESKRTNSESGEDEEEEEAVGGPARRVTSVRPLHADGLKMKDEASTFLNELNNFNLFSSRGSLKIRFEPVRFP